MVAMMVAMMAYRIICYDLFLISVDETWLSRCGAWFLGDTATEITERPLRVSCNCGFA